MAALDAADDWSFLGLDLDFQSRDIVGGKFFHHRFGCGRIFFLRRLNGGFDFGAEFIQFGLIAGQSLELGQCRHGLRGHAMSSIETNLIDGLVGFARTRALRKPAAARLASTSACFRRGSIGLDGDGVIPLRGEIDLRGRSRLGWRLRRRILR